MLSRFGLVVVAVCCGTFAFADEFPKVADSQKIDAPPSTAEQIAKSFQLPPGFEISVFAAEPAVQQPIGITTDDRGRLWVAENYTYAEAKVGFVKEYRDRVIILEDTDHDGKHDKRTVFWDKGSKLTSVAYGFGGAWVLCAPQLLFIPDRDKNDIPDGEAEVMLDGWDDKAIHHNIVNGLAWGPDGWLYGRHGIMATSNVGRPGAPAQERTRMNCGLWRFHPITKKFEVVCSGGTNSWGHDWNEHGELFFINTVIGHLWHAPPGAHFRRMYGSDLNPHVYRLIEQTADHFHWDHRKAWTDSRGDKPEHSEFGGGHAHVGMMIYQGDNWPEKYRGKMFTVNMHGLRVNMDSLERAGNSYVGKHGADFMRTSDPWFRGIELHAGMDGGVYLADWSDIGECHENDGVHRSTGRIYKITYGKPEKPEVKDVSKLEPKQLVELLKHKNQWYVRAALRNLHHQVAKHVKAEEDLIKRMEVAKKNGKPFFFCWNNMDKDNCGADELSQLFRSSDNPQHRLHAAWAIVGLRLMYESDIDTFFESKDEHIRVWTIREIATEDYCPPKMIQKLSHLAATDPSGLVRLHLASALQRLPHEKRWPIAAALASHAEDADDRTQPLMIWYGIEAAVPHDHNRAIALATTSRIPLVRQFIARRLTEQIETEPQVVETLLAVAAGSSNGNFANDILLGMQEALKGWRKAPAPRNWTTAADKLLANATTADVTRELAVVFGDGRGIEQVRKLATDNNTDPLARQNAIRVLVEAQVPDLGPQLRNWLNDRAVETAAVRGLAVYDEPQTATVMVERYFRFNNDSKPEAINVLASRPKSAAALLQGIVDGKIPRRDVTAYHARQILTFGNDEITAKLKEVWGDIRPSDTEKAAIMANLKSQLTASQLKDADVKQGRLLFNKNCAACHVLYGQGKLVGPDLTGGNRHNLDYLLENIVDPSATVAVDFRMQIFALADGRVLNGVIVEQTERTVTIQTPTELKTIDRSDIETTKPSSLSLMPDGLLKQLSPEQIRDLIAYLQTKTQVALPE